MMSVELKHHPEEWFFLHNFDIDKVFSTIQRADYLILYYIKMQAEQHPDSKVYLADLAAVMGLKVTAAWNSKEPTNLFRFLHL